MNKKKSDQLVCAHYVSKYLPLTENWIYRILINHSQYKPIMLSRKMENLKMFPIERLYALEQFSKVTQLTEIFLFKLLGYFPFFKKKCKENGAHVLHVHFGYHGVKMIGLKNELQLPMVCSFYGDDAFAFKYVNNSNFYSNLFRKVDKILVLGKYMRSQLIKLGCAENKIIIHHLGIDVEKIRFAPRKVGKGRAMRFLIASSFVEKKGIDIAVKALATFKGKFDFTLDIIGDGALKAKIMNEIEKGGLQDVVTLHGYKPYDYFINLAYECDVFIQASKTTEGNNKEGTPMAIVDVMATGLPVISTRHSDIPEMVVDDFNGYLAEENDVESLAACIRKVFEHPEKIEMFSENGRGWVEKEFNAPVQTSKLEIIYNTLIGIG